MFGQKKRAPKNNDYETVATSDDFQLAIVKHKTKGTLYVNKYNPNTEATYQLKGSEVFMKVEDGATLLAAWEWVQGVVKAQDTAQDVPPESLPPEPVPDILVPAPVPAPVPVQVTAHAQMLTSGLAAQGRIKVFIDDSVKGYLIGMKGNTATVAEHHRATKGRAYDASRVSIRWT